MADKQNLPRKFEQNNPQNHPENEAGDDVDDGAIRRGDAAGPSDLRRVPQKYE